MKSTNPATGEREDTDVGFPGPLHFVAEREWPMKIAMSVLGFGALFAGLIQVPGVTDVLDKFLDPVFEEAPISHVHPSNADEYKGMVVGGTLSILGIGMTIPTIAFLLPAGVLSDRFERRTLVL